MQRMFLEHKDIEKQRVKNSKDYECYFIRKHGESYSHHKKQRNEKHIDE